LFRKFANLLTFGKGDPMKLNLTEFHDWIARQFPIDAPHTITSKRCCLRIMDRSGDRVLEWDATAPDTDLEVMAAQDAFSKEFQKGGLAYKTTGPDEGEAIERFDKTAEEIVMNPQIIGG
jgi:hypothetical protein